MKRKYLKKISMTLAVSLCLAGSGELHQVQAARKTGFDASKEITREDLEMEQQLEAEAVPELGGETDFGQATGDESEVVFFAPDQGQPEADFISGDEENFTDGGESEAFFGSGEIFSSEETEQNEDSVWNGSEVTLQIKEGEDLTLLLNELLLQAKDRASRDHPVKVIIPPGNYRLTGTICTYSNIHLYAVGAVITKTSTTKHILLRLGNTEDSAGGYNGYHNVTIEGGVWDSNYEGCADKEQPGGFVGFRIGHATNVVIKDVTFLNNLKSHFLELAGVKDAKVTGCTFRGYWKPYELGGQECIQIDACKEEIFPGYAPYDASICENILIHGNTFENVFAGVGSHSMVFDSPYKNIRITNNKFTNIKKRAVWCLNYQDSVVDGNVMKNVGGGVYVRSMYSSNTEQGMNPALSAEQNQQPQRLVVSNNQISLAKSGVIAGNYWRSYGIQVIGEQTKAENGRVPEGKYIIREVTLKGNTITGPGNGIRLDLAEDCKVEKNKVKLSYADKFRTMGIYLGASSRNEVVGNQIYGAEGTGLYLYKGKDEYQSASIGNVIDKNKVVECVEDGILIEDRSDQTFLRGNTSVDNYGSGISVYDSKIAALHSNVANTNQRYGVFARNSEIVSQKGNQMKGNEATYAMYMAGCKGKPHSLKKIQCSAIKAGAKKISGKAMGGKTITVSLKKNNKKLGTGCLNSKGQFTVAVKGQKKGTLLLMTVTDKYQNKVVIEKKVI